MHKLMHPRHMSITCTRHHHCPRNKQLPPTYDANYLYTADNSMSQQKTGEPHRTASLSISYFPHINFLSTRPRTSPFSVPINCSFSVKAFIDTGAFSSAMPIVLLINSKPLVLVLSPTITLPVPL